MRVTLLRPAVAAPSDSDVFETRWARLSAFISAVHALRENASPPPRFSLEELHSDVVDVCVVRKAPLLYAYLRDSFTKRVAALLRPLEDEPAGVPAATFLARVADAWTTYSGELTLITRVFLHLDCTYVVEQPDARSLKDVGLANWGSILEQLDAVLTTCVRSVCELLHRERGGEDVDRGVLTTVVRMFQAVSLFSSSLVPPVLATTEDFYHLEGNRLVSEVAVPTYLLHVEARLRREVRATAAAVLRNASTAFSVNPLIQTSHTPPPPPAPTD